MAKRRRSEKEVGVEVEVEEDRLKGTPSGKPPPEGNAQIHPEDMGKKSSKQLNKRRRDETEVGVELEVGEDRLNVMASEKPSTNGNAQKHPEEEGQKSSKQPRKRKRNKKKLQWRLKRTVCSRFIYTNKRLRQFPCHVSNYSSLHTLRDIRNSLSEYELAQVRKTSIGHLVDMPESQKWEIRVGPEQTREGEVPFRVEGKDLCFCKALQGVTCLPFKESGEEIELKGVSHLKKKHFEGIHKVEGTHLYEFLVFRTKPMVQGAGADALRNPILSGKSKKRPRKLRNREHVPCSSDERVKLALLLMVHVFILGRQLQHKIDDQDWLSVENIEHFNKIPWGEKSYVLCFENTKKAIKYQNNKEDPTAKLSLKPRGLPQALVVWMLKLFPHLLEKYGSESRTKGQRPLIVTVWCEEVINYEKLCEIMKGVVYSDDRLQEIRAGGEAFRDAAWEEAVSENHDLEDA